MKLVWCANMLKHVSTGLIFCAMKQT